MIQGYILLGSPGSGKGTIGQFMKPYATQHIASGDILRKEVKENTPIGKQTQALIQEGKQVPDALITEIVLKRLEECIKKKFPFVLDGFPQTLSQLESLHGFLQKHPEYQVKTLCVEVEPKTALQRMTERISCPQCERIYNKATTPPLNPDTCDACAIPLTSRESDKEEAAKARLWQFERTTKKVMDFVRSQPNVFCINGNSPIYKVQEQLIPILNNRPLA